MIRSGLPIQQAVAEDGVQGRGDADMRHLSCG